jgi:hypothetical protein
MDSLPKAEVHLHLEGYFGAVTVAQWAKMEGSSGLGLRSWVA